MEKNARYLEIEEIFTNYKPPFDAKGIAQLLIRYIPPIYLGGLKRVILTNSSALSHDRRRERTWHRNRKIKISDSQGAYQQQWKGNPAYIEIFVDNALEGRPGTLLKIPFIRDMSLASVLYHEIGHHIHRTIYPEYQEREKTAEDWNQRLMRLYFKKRYWYLLPFLYPVYLCISLVITIAQQVRKYREAK